jgi:DNA-binding response OmpR family regulator
LLADDDVIVRNFIRNLLEAEGFSVLVAADGDEALKLSLAHEGTIDLLLTDVEMPHFDGISTYRKIIAKRPNIKVVFMSGGLHGNLRLPQFAPFLRKPFTKDTLLTQLNELLAVAPPTNEDLKVILVVDQNNERKARTKKILTDNGYAVLLSNTAEEAEVFVDGIRTIDLIISEVVFAGESGVDLAEHAEVSDINTLLISHFHPDLLRNVRGFSKQQDFLANPFTPEALLTRVHQLLS